MHALLDLPADQLPIADAVAERLLDVQRVFNSQLDTDLPPVRDLVRHVERYRGKMLRPVLVLVSGMAAHPSAARTPAEAAKSLLTHDHTVVAAVIEMVHMATLVHDDVLDDAEVRRRGATVNNLHGNEAAVMLGDYLLASAYHLCSTLSSNGPALAVARASVVTCAGELLQLHHRQDFSLDEATYFEIVARKTGELIATAAELGAMCSGADARTQRTLAAFGRDVGVAFQVQDDLLDLLGAESTVGKSVGKDIENGKLTLPVIHYLSLASATERGRMLGMLERASGDPSHALAEEMGSMLERSGSVEYAKAKATEYVKRACDGLATLPDSPAKRTMLAMADAVVGRAY
ncbi:MAG TPA: polyprenyl synthetase family protein [Phycisphaerales bacterium]|nr:polyprenyl synthetase family protein [Phycisphaerales bacterium]